jgi:hypothetical protein
LTLIHTEIGMLLVQPVSSSCVKTHLVSKFWDWIWTLFLGKDWI